MIEIPNDEDAQALVALRDLGVDLDAPMNIEFTIETRDENTAESVAAALEEQEYSTQIFSHNGDLIDPESAGGADWADPKKVSSGETGGVSMPCWTVSVTVKMIPAHEAILSLQSEIEQMVHEFDIDAIGWGALIG